MLQGACLVLGCGAVTGIPESDGFSYFHEPAQADPWSVKIRGWQTRERHSDALDDAREPHNRVAAGPNQRKRESDAGLREKYLSFRSEHRRDMARGLAGWIQEQSERHYIPDGAVDHWATLEETLVGNGDDCDGLELLAYNALRDMGFGEDRVYRAIVFRPSDGQHHMVTFWFEELEDPWVIDPTGAMVRGMPRMSEVPGWVPLKVFSEDEEFTVRSAGGHKLSLQRTPAP